MSQRDLVAELRSARIEAPAEVREHVRAIAATAAPPPRRIAWRRVLIVAIPVAAAVAATVVFTRPARQEAQHQTVALRAMVRGSAAVTGAPTHAFAPAPSPTRVQRYGAYLALRVPTPDGVSAGIKSALAVTRSLGGYAVSVHAAAAGRSATADLTLKIPRGHVQDAIRRLSALGTITAEQVDVQDLQAGIDTTNSTIARLQRQIAELRAQPQTEVTTVRIAALVAQVQRLQRAEAATTRSARYATVNLHLARPAGVQHKRHHGPLHGLAVAFRWLGIGAVYALALGGPLLLVLWLAWLGARTVRRRREDQLLSRP